MHKTGVIGIDNVISNIHKRLELYHEQSANGMREAIAYIREDMERTPPLIPVDTNKLRGSWHQSFHRGIGGKPGAIFGFEANYALYVHERMDPNIKWQRPGSGPKFFEAALKRNKNKIIELIGRNMKT